MAPTVTSTPTLCISDMIRIHNYSCSTCGFTLQGMCSVNVTCDDLCLKSSTISTLRNAQSNFTPLFVLYCHELLLEVVVIVPVTSQ